MIQKSNRKEILEAAYWLFHEKGYNATSLEDIGKSCNVTKQAITYHFGSKGGLGREVASLIAERIHENFKIKVIDSIPDCTYETINAANLIWFSQVYKYDEKAFRFFREFILRDENFVDLMKVLQPKYEQRLSQGESNPIQAVKQLQTLSTFYAAQGLLYHYAMGTLVCSEELFEQYYFRNFYQPYYSESEIRRIYEAGKKVLQTLGEDAFPYTQNVFM